jgi:RimJ/RimL family protein N-acetyltransferase
LRPETERLLLRPWEDRDRAPLAAIMGDPHTRRFYPRTLTPQETSAEIDLATEAASSNGFHFQAAELKDSGALAGLIGLGIIPDATRAAIAGHPRVEIGWVLDRRVWGQGLAPEGARAWLDYAWTVLALPEIVAFTAAVNLPSQRVMEKIGMARDPSADFDHPKLPPGHRLRAHVLYRISSPGA